MSAEVEEDRAELARLQEVWMSAMQQRDMDTLERLVADGFRFMAIHLNPEPMTREQWMGAAREGYTIVSFAYESFSPRNAIPPSVCCRLYVYANPSTGTNRNARRKTDSLVISCTIPLRIGDCVWFAKSNSEIAIAELLSSSLKVR